MSNVIKWAGISMVLWGFGGGADVAIAGGLEHLPSSGIQKNAGRPSRSTKESGPPAYSAQRVWKQYYRDHSRWMFVSSIITSSGGLLLTIAGGVVIGTGSSMVAGVTLLAYAGGSWLSAIVTCIAGIVLHLKAKSPPQDLESPRLYQQPFEPRARLHQGLGRRYQNGSSQRMLSWKVSF